MKLTQAFTKNSEPGSSFQKNELSRSEGQGWLGVQGALDHLDQCVKNSTQKLVPPGYVSLMMQPELMDTKHRYAPSRLCVSRYTLG